MKTTSFAQGFFLRVQRRLCFAALSILLVFAAPQLAQATQTVYVSDYLDGQVQYFIVGGGNGTLPSGIPNATGLAFDTQGNLYICSSSVGDPPVSSIWKYSTTTGTLTQWFTDPTPSVLGQPHGLALDAAGNLYVATLHLGTVEKIQVKANGNPGLYTAFASGLASPFAVAFDSHGNVFVTDGAGGTDGAGSVVKYNPSGSQSQVWAQGADKFDVAYGIAIDPSDNVYVSNEGNSTIREFDSHKNLLGSFPITNISVPLGLLFDPSTNLLYVNNKGTTASNPLTDTIYTFSSLTDPGTLFVNTLRHPHFLALLNSAIP